jgi:hypothetical protein
MPTHFRGPLPPDHPLFTGGPSFVLKSEEYAAQMRLATEEDVERLGTVIGRVVRPQSEDSSGSEDES